MQIYVPQSERSVHDIFMKMYMPYKLIVTGTVISQSLKPEQERSCRFCKKKYPETRFTTKAHIIPYQLGNTGYIWDEECDTCNNFFSRFETNLSYFLGVHRSLQDIKGGNRFPTFSNQDDSVQVKRLNSDFTVFERKDKESGFRFDKEQAQLDINVSRRTYVPAFVYNAFLKMALSILPESDIAGYSLAYKYLMNGENYDNLNGPRRVIVAKSSHGYNYPFAILFQRKEKDQSLPYHIFCLYVRQFMFQIAFPMHLNEVSQTEKTLTVHKAPYVDLTNTMQEPITITRHEEDLHSTEKFKDQTNWISLKFDPETLKNLVSVKLPEGALIDIFNFNVKK